MISNSSFLPLWNAPSNTFCCLGAKERNGKDIRGEDCEEPIRTGPSLLRNQSVGVHNMIHFLIKCIVGCLFRRPEFIW